MAGGAHIWLLLFAHSVGDFYSAMVSPLLPYLKENLGLSLGAAGALGAAFQLVANYAQPFFGIISERLGRKRVLALGVLAAGITSLMGVASGIWLIVPVLVLGALGVAAFHPTGAAIAGTAFRQSSLRISLYMAGGNLGVVLAPLIVPRILPFGAPYLALLFVPSLIMAALLWRGLPADTHTTNDRGPVLKDALHLFKRLWPIHLDVVLRFFPLMAYMLYLPLFGKARGQSDAVASYSLAVLMATGTAGILCGGWLTTHLRERPFLVISEVVAGVTLLLAPMTHGPVFYVLIAVGGFFGYTVVPLQLAAAQRLAPKSESAASGVVMGLAYGNATLLLLPLSWLGNVWAAAHTEAVSTQWMLQVPAIALFAAALISALSPREKEARIE